MLPSAGEFFKSYGLTPEKLALAKPDAIVMHPGPINRGVEIDSAVADGAHSVILPQVTFGIAVRMAVMSHHRRQRERMKILIQNGRVIDPASGPRRDAPTSPSPPAASSRIGSVAADFRADRAIDAARLIVAPGLVDLAARLREPGPRARRHARERARPRPRPAA